MEFFTEKKTVTAPELKLVLGRHAHEENIHADSLLYMISSLGINPHECEAMFEQVDTIREKNEFVTGISKLLRRDLDLEDPANKALLAKNIFVFGQCMEGTQFYGLFALSSTVTVSEYCASDSKSRPGGLLTVITPLPESIEKAPPTLPAVIA